MRALSIRQPTSGGAEQILRGEKTIEPPNRSRSVGGKIIGERFYIYASRKWGLTSRDRKGAVPLDLPTAPLPDGRGSFMTSLPTGVIVGSAIIRKCVRNNGHYEWHLSSVKRLKRPRRVKGQPQPVWFRPW